MKRIGLSLFLVLGLGFAAYADFADVFIGKARKAHAVSGAQERVQQAKARRQDPTSPTVTLTAPSAYQKSYSTVRISGNAGDNIGVVKIEFQAGTAPWVTVYSGPAVASKEFTFDWDSSQQSDGTLQIRVAAHDEAGNRAEASVPILLDNVNAAWWQAKTSQTPEVMVSGYGTPYMQLLSGMGWEDGIYISRDGLSLYCTYIPADTYSFSLAAAQGKASLDTYYLYQRGPTYGMDLITNPAGSYPWFHTDILYARRNSTADSFTTWQLSGLARPIFSEGAICGISADAGTYDWVLFTSTDTPPTYHNNFRFMRNVSRNPSGVGTTLCASSNNMDNPHIERLDVDHLVLFFDSDNWPLGLGPRNIFYTTSADGGTTWAAPQSVASINTNEDEEQPHLYQEASGQWWLYFSAAMPDGKLGIYRARQSTAGNWDSWTGKELVIGPGTAMAVGEPSLTSAGDISFVVMTKKADGTEYNMYDADPWFAPILK